MKQLAACFGLGRIMLVTKAAHRQIKARVADLMLLTNYGVGTGGGVSDGSIPASNDQRIIDVHVAPHVKIRFGILTLYQKKSIIYSTL